MADRIRIRILRRFVPGDLVRIGGGYVSQTRFEVRWSDRRGRTTFTLRPVRLRTPFRKVFPHPAEDLTRYRRVVRLGWSLGAYDGKQLVGLALAEPRNWNRSVWVWEFGVTASHRRRGIGTRLIRELDRRASEEGFRILVCETQTTNGPAMEFYRSVGFRLEGVDVSYYSNEDLRKGEVAVFMKRRVASTMGARRRRRRGRRRTSE